MAEIAHPDMAAEFPLRMANYAESAASGETFGFSLNRERVSAALRSLADAVASGEAIGQSLTQSTYLKLDDFVMHELKFEFAVKRSL